MQLTNLKLMPAAPLLALGLALGPASADAALIAPISATATSQLDATYAPIRAINGSGLNAPDDQTATHNAGSGVNTMWLSSNVGVTTAVGQSITFDLGSEMDLDGAFIWNYNQDNQSGRGFLNFDIFVGGAADPTATTFLEAASIVRYPVTSGVARGAEFEAFSANDVRYLRFVSTSNGNNNVIGLSEVRFSSVAAVPEPTSLALLGLSGLLMGARRRRIA